MKESDETQLKKTYGELAREKLQKNTPVLRFT